MFTHHSAIRLPAHLSLGYLTPIQVYQTTSCGGARIVDKFVERKDTLKTEAAPVSCATGHHLKLDGLLS